MLTNTDLTDEALLRDIGPTVAQYLATYRPMLPPDARQTVQKQTLLTVLAIRRKATRQRLNWRTFARRIAGEQVLVWKAQRGTVSQQAHAQTQLMAQNQPGVDRYLRSHYTFRTTDVVEEVISDTFSAFYALLAKQQSVEALLLTCLIGIARHKALHQLRHERSSGQRTFTWLETAFITIDEAETGAFEWPIGPDDQADDEQVYPLPNDLGSLPPVTMAQLRQWLVDCFDQLPPKRQELIRQKHKYLTAANLKTMSIEAIEALYKELDMSGIAQVAGYSSGHIASVRLNESHAALHDCIQRHRQQTPR